MLNNIIIIILLLLSGKKKPDTCYRLLNGFLTLHLPVHEQVHVGMCQLISQLHCVFTSPGDGLRLINLVKEKERQTSVWSIEPGPKYWKSGTISTKPLLQTKVCLILPYVLPVVVDCPVNLTLTTTLVLYCQNRSSSPSEEPHWMDLRPIVFIFSLVHSRLLHLLIQVKYRYAVCVKSHGVFTTMEFFLWKLF